jgi:hypothetical protein
MVVAHLFLVFLRLHVLAEAEVGHMVLTAVMVGLAVEAEILEAAALEYQVRVTLVLPAQHMMVTQVPGVAQEQQDQALPEETVLRAQ